MTSQYTFPHIEAVRQTLRDCGLTGREIYDATGIGQPWQQAFRDGRAKDPAYTRIIELVRYLENVCPDLLASNIEIHGGQ